MSFLFAFISNGLIYDPALVSHANYQSVPINLLKSSSNGPPNYEHGPLEWMFNSNLVFEI